MFVAYDLVTAIETLNQNGRVLITSDSLYSEVAAALSEAGLAFVPYLDDISMTAWVIQVVPTIDTFH